MTSLIDADSLVYILGYNHREHQDIPFMYKSIDDFVRTILTMTQADEYLGTFSAKSCFRHEVYKYAPYKGNRPPKAEWLLFWEPIIKKYLIEEWGFIVPDDLEADDVVCALAEVFKGDCCICSPDKDMKQIEGIHFDYSKSIMTPISIDADAAYYNLWVQVLRGDGGDNIAGVPGLGEVKAAKIFVDIDNTFQYPTVVRQQYCKYYGPYYGPIIFDQTQAAIQLMSTKHSLYGLFFDKIDCYVSLVRQVPEVKVQSGFDSIQE